MIISNKNRKHIWFALLLIVAIGLLIAGFSGCTPSRETCQRLYPAQYKDTSTIKHDSIQVPYLVLLPGDTIYLSGKVDKPCPDSVRQWSIFTAQVNAILWQNNKYKQTISFELGVFTSQLKISQDSLLKYKTLYKDLEIKTHTQIMPVVSYLNKVAPWCWWVMGCLLFIVLTLGAVLILKK